MTPMPLGLFVKKLQPKVGLASLAGYDILFAYVEAKSNKWKTISNLRKCLPSPMKPPRADTKCLEVKMSVDPIKHYWNIKNRSFREKK